MMLKSADIIQALPDDSSEVIVNGLLDHYASRPQQWSSICLADFVSHYKRIRKADHPSQQCDDVEDYPLECNTPDLTEVASCDSYSLGNGYISKRRQTSVCVR